MDALQLTTKISNNLNNNVSKKKKLAISATEQSKKTFLTNANSVTLHILSLLHLIVKYKVQAKFDKARLKTLIATWPKLKKMKVLNFPFY